ncbi:hypothetical protein LINPERPRIM_LOCUS17949 [Linum perenne]
MSMEEGERIHDGMLVAFGYATFQVVTDDYTGGATEPADDELSLDGDAGRQTERGVGERVKLCLQPSLHRRSLVTETLKGTIQNRNEVSEKCPSGQVFFVLIPADVKTGGWMFFLRNIQELLEIKPSKAEVIPTRSFAEVVAGPSFPLIGRCSKTSLVGEGSILVEDVGVKDRQVFLSKCLVMRFVGTHPLCWDEFHKWSSIAWGIPAASTFLPLGDDLWMLVCSSSKEF